MPFSVQVCLKGESGPLSGLGQNSVSCCSAVVVFQTGRVILLHTKGICMAPIYNNLGSPILSKAPCGDAVASMATTASWRK